MKKDDERQNGKEQNRRKRKKKRDRAAERVKGQMPAPPLSAYNFFFRAERLGGSNGKRDELDNNEEGPSTEADTKGSSDFRTMTKSIGRKWRELPAAEKLIYEELAKEDLGRYRRELAEYNEELIWSTKIGRASLEGRKKHTTQNQSGDGRGDDSKPSAYETRIAEPGVVAHDRFPGFSTLQFARPPLQSSRQSSEPASFDNRERGTHMGFTSSLSSQHEQLLRQQVAGNVLLQHLLSGIAQTSGGMFEQRSAMSILPQIQASNASENDRFANSASSRASLYERMLDLQNSQMGERLSNDLSSPTASHPQSAGAQGTTALWQLQHQIPNPNYHDRYAGQLPTLAEMLVSQSNQNALAQFQARQIQPNMAQNANQTNLRDQQTLLRHRSDAEPWRTIASNPALDSQDLLRLLFEEEERSRQQR